ncbi:MAG TPA: DUF4296 domain-containing protein [Bacteroidetes bacterium]|nr:DUF4296 domain-containing protein [Bacteroidota bacterium]
MDFHWKYGFLFLFLAAVTSGCREASLCQIEEEKLVALLSDIHVAEAGLTKISGREKDSIAQALYAQVFAIHQVSQTTLDSCLAILKKNPIEMERIYNKVVKNLENRKEDEEAGIRNEHKR